MAAKPTKYVVTVMPPRKPSIGVTGAMASSYTIPDPPRVVTITATSAKKAAERANVLPGGTAHVTKESDVYTFKRPATAPLVAA